MKTISTMALRKKLGAVLERVSRTHRPVTVARREQPLVVLVPYADYGNADPRAGRLRRLSGAFERIDAWRARHARKLAGFDPVRAVREVREDK